MKDEAARVRYSLRRRLRHSDHPAAPSWFRRTLGRRVAVLFMTGSFLFGMGVIPAYAEAVGPSVQASTFFLGSLLFTSAGYLQFLQVVNAPDDAGNHEARWRWFAFQPARLDWWAASIQSVGTILFNISTFAATLGAISASQQHRLIWAPDMLGSIAFLVASSLAWWDVCHSVWEVHIRDVSWWVVALNLLGSIAFQVSAVGAYIDPASGAVRNIPVANLGTFVGAVCFFLGALLLLPEVSRAGNRDSNPFG